MQFIFIAVVVGCFKEPAHGGIMTIVVNVSDGYVMLASRMSFTVWASNENRQARLAEVEKTKAALDERAAELWARITG